MSAEFTDLNPPGAPCCQGGTIASPPKSDTDWKTKHDRLEDESEDAWDVMAEYVSHVMEEHGQDRGMEIPEKLPNAARALIDLTERLRTTVNEYDGHMAAVLAALEVGASYRTVLTLHQRFCDLLPGKMAYNLAALTARIRALRATEVRANEPIQGPF